MTQSEEEVAATASGVLRLAMRRLMAEFPLYAHLLAGWVTRCDPAGIETCGVTTMGARIFLNYNPHFVLTCTLEELESVLQHEVHHVLLGHLFLDPTKFDDELALTIATEVTANEWIKGPLPGKPILLEHYPQLPPNEDTLTRYRRLARRRSGPPGSPWNKASPGRRCGGKRSGAARKRRHQGPRRGSRGLKPVGPRARPLDDHTGWNPGGPGRELSLMAIRVRVREALSALSPQAWEQLPSGLRQELENPGVGSGPGAGLEAVPPGSQGQIDWRCELARFVGRRTEPTASYNRPPRRFPALAGICPGHRWSLTRNRVMVVVDTSGSIRPGTLARFGAELRTMARTHDLIVVECDVIIHRVYPFRGGLETVAGRGGTDLRPPFEPDFLHAHLPDVLIYLTDGVGRAPREAPGLPVVWCLTSNGRVPAPWGRVLRLPRE